MRKICGPKWNEVTGEWRRPLNEELYYLYFSQHVTGMIESRMKWASHVWDTGEVRTGGETSVKEATWKNHE